MHELALADAVIRAAVEAADREGMSEITAIEVRIGELQQIRRETFEFALKEILPAGEARLANVEFRLETEPARLRCRPCGEPFDMSGSAGSCSEDELEAIHFIPEIAHSYLRCPRCASPDFEVVEGRGVTLSRLEGT